MSLSSDSGLITRSLNYKGSIARQSERGCWTWEAVLSGDFKNDTSWKYSSHTEVMLEIRKCSQNFATSWAVWSESESPGRLKKAEGRGFKDRVTFRSQGATNIPHPTPYKSSWCAADGRHPSPNCWSKVGREPTEEICGCPRQLLREYVAGCVWNTALLPDNSIAWTNKSCK